MIVIVLIYRSPLKKKAPCGEHGCFSSFEKIEMYNQNHTLDKLSYSFVQQKGKKIIFLQKR